MGVGLRLKHILRDRKMTIKQLAGNANIPVNALVTRVLATLRARNKINFKASHSARPFGFVIYPK